MAIKKEYKIVHLRNHHIEDLENKLNIIALDGDWYVKDILKKDVNNTLPNNVNCTLCVLFERDR